MIWLLALLGVAQADPSFLRVPGALDYGMTFETARYATGGWIKPSLGWGFSWNYPANVVELSVGTQGRFTALGSKGHWNLVGQLAGGPIVPILDPDIGLAVTPGLAFMYQREEFHMSYGLAVPFAITFIDDVQARIPFLAEAYWMWEVGDDPNGRVFLGFGGRSGVSVNPGNMVSAVGEAFFILGFGGSRAGGVWTSAPGGSAATGALTP